MSSEALSTLPEPFGYFRALPFGWEGCAETDDGAQALYDEGAIRTQAARIAELEAERDQLQQEVNEQARLNGMGAERELALIAARDQLRAEVERLRTPLTDELITALANRARTDIDFARAIEAAKEA